MWSAEVIVAYMLRNIFFSFKESIHYVTAMCDDMLIAIGTAQISRANGTELRKAIAENVCIYIYGIVELCAMCVSV